MKLLVVEDDRRVADFLDRGLRAEGHAISVVRTGREALDIIAESPPEVVILDVMLPGMSGLDVCHELRVVRNRTPILMLTAMGSTEDKVTGLRMGADDYMTKPFAFDELLARLDALHRRATNGEQNSSVLVVGELTFNRETLEVHLGGRAIELTAKELALLELLMSKPGTVFSRSRILSSVWGASSDPLTSIVDVYVSRLRTTLYDPGDSGLITTVRGSGYKLAVVRRS